MSKDSEKTKFINMIGEKLFRGEPLSKRQRLLLEIIWEQGEYAGFLRAEEIKDRVMASKELIN